MKGVIPVCLKELVEAKFGRATWEKVLEKSGLDRKETHFTARDDVPDETVLALVRGLCAALGLSLPSAADAFGEYWVTVFSQKLYWSHYTGVKSSREFLLKMDKVHQQVTQNIPGAKPPHFEFEIVDDKTILMKYKSPRKMLDFAAGLVKGVGRQFNENLKVVKVGDSALRVTFP